MRLRFISILLLVFLSACNNSEVTDNAMQTNDDNYTFTILALGDSLTEGLGVAEKDSYPSKLQRLLPKHFKVINAGLSGETSSGLVNRLDWVLKQKPDLTILNIGANDAMRGLPIELTTQNIDSAISKIKNSGSDVILCGMNIYNNLGVDYVNGFMGLYPKLAKKHHIPLIPFFLEHIAGVPKYNQDDGLHPNAMGYQIIVNENILPIIEDYLEQL